MTGSFLPLNGGCTLCGRTTPPIRLLDAAYHIHFPYGSVLFRTLERVHAAPQEARKGRLPSIYCSVKNVLSRLRSALSASSTPQRQSAYIPILEPNPSSVIMSTRIHDAVSHVEAQTHDGDVDISSKFDGQRHWSWAKWKSYTAPTITAIQDGVVMSELYIHRDSLGRKTVKPKDVLHYVSPTDAKAIRALVQATPEACLSPPGDWRRRELGGNAPKLLRLSCWVLQELQRNERGALTASEWATIAARVLMVSPLMLLIVSFPMGGPRPLTVFYKRFPARCWEHPKYARNELLDGKPGAYRSNPYNFAGEYVRLLRPRRLVFLREDGPFVEADHLPENTSGVPYLFISYTREHFDPKDHEACGPLYQVAERMTREASLGAYWLDHLCITQEQGLDQSDDINRISDVIRGARQLVVVVPDLRPATLAAWGGRVWTLPEALLCQNELIKFCEPSGKWVEMSRIELADEVWRGDQNGRLLAENFSGSLSLGRLELISRGLDALSCRRTERFSDADLAYALMTLLGHRPRANPTDNQFQALARLSLANDSDRIVERMICMLPDYSSHNSGSRHNNKFVLKDQLGANLWDIEPICQIGGVCEGSALILDGCRGASIRWKDIPPIAYMQRKTWKRLCAAIALRSGALWFLFGVSMVSFGKPLRGIGIFFLLLSLILILSLPWSIVSLYGGKVWGAAPWLIGFEGTLPITEIEHMTFGDAIGRLSYAPSSSLYQCKDDGERIGKGPAWIEESAPKPELPRGQRFFTLIDTGTLTVNVFAAERPPSVALIVGREGGMLRVALCHYERSTATLFKETVLRMETPMMDYAGNVHLPVASISPHILPILVWSPADTMVFRAAWLDQGCVVLDLSKRINTRSAVVCFSRRFLYLDLFHARLPKAFATY
jgi:hypothetical protein